MQIWNWREIKMKTMQIDKRKYKIYENETKKDITYIRRRWLENCNKTSGKVQNFTNK